MDRSGLGGCGDLTGLANWTYITFSGTSGTVQSISFTKNSQLIITSFLQTLQQLVHLYAYTCLKGILFHFYGTASIDLSIFVCLLVFILPVLINM